MGILPVNDFESIHVIFCRRKLFMYSIIFDV